MRSEDRYKVGTRSEDRYKVGMRSEYKNLWSE